MTNEPEHSADTPEDELFAAALEEYYRRLAKGPVDWRTFAVEFPEVQTQLVSFFQEVAVVEGLAKTLPAQTAQPVALGTIRYFGDYELIEEIARGGMGIVFKARQVSLNRIVAVKMILAGRLASDEDVARFRQEAAGAAQLRHPNIVSIYEVGECEGQHFFSMEYVEGNDLAQLVREKLFSSAQSAEIVRTIALAMNVVHRQGLLHRDLKPSNVLIETHSGTVRITDFGLAKNLDVETVYTSTGQILGTPSYMAPEQAAGQHELIGPGSDIYAIGAILYELATGRPPFRGETPWDTAWQVRNTEVVAPSTLNPKMPRDLETICLKCLHKEISRRYLNAQELADDLERFQRGEPVHARPVSRAERVWRWCRRNPALATASGAAIVGFVALLTSLAVFGSVQRKNAETLSSALDLSEIRRREGNMRLAETERDKGLRLCQQGDIDQGCLWLARSLATAPPDATDLRWSIRINLGAWQRELCTLQALFPEEEQGLAFSRDGQRFATESKDTVKVRETATGAVVGPPLQHEQHIRVLMFGPDHDTLLLQSTKGFRLCQKTNDGWSEKEFTAPIGGFIGYHLTPENHVLTAHSTSQGIRITDQNNGNELGKPLPSDKYEPGKVVFSPDGKFALTQPKRDRLVLSDLQTGTPVGRPMMHPDHIWVAAFSPDGQRIVTGTNHEKGEGRPVDAQEWDATTATSIGAPLAHPDAKRDLSEIQFSADGERLLTSTQYETFRVFDRKRNLLAGPIRHSGSVILAGNGRLISYVSRANESRLFDVDTHQVVGQPLGLFDNLSHVSLSPDGRYLLTGTPLGTKLWSVPDRGMIAPPLIHAPETFEGIRLAFSHDSQHLLSTGNGGQTVHVWDTRTGKSESGPMSSQIGIGCCALSPDGRYAITGSMHNFPFGQASRGLFFWDTVKGKAIPRKLPKDNDLTHAVAFTTDGKLIITLGGQGKIHLYDVDRDEIKSGEMQHPMPDIDGQRLFMAVSPDDQVLAVCSEYESDVSLWDLATGKMLNEPSPSTHGIVEVAFSPDSKTLATIGDELSLRDVASGKPLSVKILCPAKALSVVFSPNGHFLATAHVDRVVRLWNVATGKPAGRAMEHSESPTRVAFALDGKLLLVSTSSGSHLWEPFSGTQVGPKLHSSTISCVSPDGRTIAGATGREIRLWKVPEPSADEGAEALRKVEAATTLSLDADGQIRQLGREEWEKRRK